MGVQPRKLQPNEISLFKSLGIDFFEALFMYKQLFICNNLFLETLS